LIKTSTQFAAPVLQMSNAAICWTH